MPSVGELRSHGGKVAKSRDFKKVGSATDLSSIGSLSTYSGSDHCAVSSNDSDGLALLEGLRSPRLSIDQANTKVPEAEASVELGSIAPSLSEASSGCRYVEPSQTLIFLDWDDTLFPTTEIFDRYCVSRYASRQELTALGPCGRSLLPREMQSTDDIPGLEKWKEALEQCLRTACSLSDRCVIVTNSSPLWVEACIQRFVPEIAELFRSPHGPRVVYAEEALKEARAARRRRLGACVSGCLSWLDHLFEDCNPEDPTPEEHERELTEAKHAAMRQEAVAFYSRYPKQSWKNVVSIGDMPYEHNAMRSLCEGRASDARRATERLRSKALLLPTGPTMSEITLRLQITRLLLPAYVRLDGDLDLDLREVQHPLQEIANALEIPQLAALPFDFDAWGADEEDDHAVEVEEALAEVAVVVHDALFHDV